MRAVLIYNLSNPDEREAHLRAIKSTDLALTVLAIQEEFRKLLKYSQEENPTITLEEVVSKIHRICDEHSLDLNELIS